MASGRLIKLLVFELLEFAAFSIPTLVIVEQFAIVYQKSRNTGEKTHYWLMVSCSIAYVASVSLLIWVPIKVLLYKKHHLSKKIKGWRPVMMMCVVLTTLPSFSFSIAVTEVQKNINGSANLPDTLPDLPVSLVLTSLIVVDIIEKLRTYPLRGRQKKVTMTLRIEICTLQRKSQSSGEDSRASYITASPSGAPLCPNLRGLISVLIAPPCTILSAFQMLTVFFIMTTPRGNEDTHIHATTLQRIKTVTDQERQNEGNPAPPQPAPRTTASAATTRSTAPAQAGPEEPTFQSGVLRAMSQRDARAEIFLWSFLLWSDTIEMVRVAGHQAVYKSAWVYPVYLFSFISLLRIIFTPQNPLLNSLGILLQDLPFIFVRLSLIIDLGTVTPVLGLCKNVLVTLSYVYFNYLTKFRVFSSFELSSF